MTVDLSNAEAFLDPDASRDYLRSWTADAQHRAERARAMAAQIDGLRASAKDGNNLVEVTVDSSGVLVNLVLTERIHRYAPAVVSRAVMTALREARTKAAEQARKIAVEAMGPDSMSARVMAERMQQILDRSDAVEGSSDRGPGDGPIVGRPGAGSGWVR